MRQMIALASPELVLDAYTGTHGLYAAVMPTDEHCQYLISLASSFDVQTDKDKLHCTLMYSPDVFPKTAPVVDPARQFHARIRCVDWWPGHDRKGYLTAQLTSTDLQQEHRRLLALGCRHTFQPFMPHLTLWAGIQRDIKVANMMASINAQFAGNQPEIILSGETIADMKQD